MQNLKYHLINSAAVIVFSLFTALTINSVIRYNISPVESKATGTQRVAGRGTNVSHTFDHYQDVIDAGFFHVAAMGPDTEVGAGSVSTVDELNLLGTITGPASIARALIQKRGERNPKIFALYRISKEINNDVYGYKLVRIANSKVYLKSNGEKLVLDMFGKSTSGSTKKKATGLPSGQIIKKTISRAELQQKLSKNWDNMLKGLTARPYRVNGVVKGYRLIRIRPYNLLYKFGVRSGDIIERINDYPVDNMNKLLQVWTSLKNESRIQVHVKRHNRNISYDFNITD